MNWSKAKTILILFFLFTNTFLLFHIINSANVASKISPSVVDSAMTILEKNQITIDEALIPKRNYDLALPMVQNAIVDYEAFAKQILGDDATADDAGVYRSALGEVQFRGDYFEFIPADPGYGGLSEARSLKNAAKELIKDFGFDLSRAKVRAEQADTQQVVRITKDMAGFPVFDCAISVFVKDDGLQRVEGSWFMEIEKPLIYEKTTIKNAPGALIDFCTLPSRPDVAMTISALEPGYVVGDAANHHETATLVPVWRIVTAENGEYYMDGI